MSCAAVIAASAALMLPTAAHAGQAGHAVTQAVRAPMPGEHGGPGVCDASRDGEYWTDETIGQTFQCRRINGRWGWYMVFGSCPSPQDIVKDTVSRRALPSAAATVDAARC